MENGLKALILAASISITCLVISIGFYAARQARDISAITTEKINKTASHLAEEEYILYDDLVIRGSDLVNFIVKNFSSNSIAKDLTIYIYVDSGRSKNKYESYEDIRGIKDFNSSNYINPLGKYKGKIIRNQNEVIIGMSFVAE